MELPSTSSGRTLGGASRRLIEASQVILWQFVQIRVIFHQRDESEPSVVGEIPSSGLEDSPDEPTGREAADSDECKFSQFCLFTFFYLLSITSLPTGNWPPNNY